ncbi:DUF6247 family protein [Phytoactinopolyspora alkaliphila]|uniref:DUF6247 family protein n=1 Tax=Phytoactinopolyspora alkaliphila TaxID=1783498 RepID=UPI001C202A62|nr:DUF6247 family protein [Phytoactinopolyspora alkaliphila]
MSTPAEPLPGGPPTPPAADPAATRARLSWRIAVEFDTEWDIALERAKQSKDLTGVHEFLRKWQYIAHTETTDPGSYFRVLAKAEQITRTGHNPDAVPNRADARTHPATLGRS